MSTLNKISLNGVSYDIGTGTFFVGPTSSDNPFVLEGHAPGIYVFENGLPFIKRLNTDTSYWRNPLEDCRINLIATPTSSTKDGTILFTYLSGEFGDVPKIASFNSSSRSGGLAAYGAVSGIRTITYLEGDQTVSGTKTFSTLPESSVVPTTNNQLVNKKYVDDLIPTQTILTDTLTAGNTTLTFTDSSILTSSLIDVYTDTFGVNPTNMTSSTGELILTFPAQTDDVDVKVVIR